MDPRIRNRTHNLDPAAKRPPSQSPDGGAARKIQKTNAGDGLPSRQSSVSSAAPRVPSMYPMDEGRRLSDQLQSEFRRETNYSAFNSPDSLGSKRSHYEDASSGRTTPVSARGMATPVNLAPGAGLDGSVNGAGPGQITSTSSSVSESDKPMVELLMGFGKQVTNVATLEVAKAQAESRLKKATTEYENMRPQFASFPIIKEQKTMAKSIAEREFKELQEQTTTGLSEQKRLAESLATLFGQTSNAVIAPAARKAAEPVVADYVPQAKYDALEKRLEALGKESVPLHKHDALEKRFALSERELARLKAVADKAASESGQVPGSSIEALKISNGLTEKRLSYLSGQIDRLREDLEKRMPSGLDSETKRRVDHLYTNGQVLVKEIGNLKDKVEVLSKAAKGPKPEAQQPTTAPDDSAQTDVPSLNKIWSDFYYAGGVMSKRDEELGEIVTEEVKKLQDQIDAIRNSGPRSTADIQQSLEAFEGRLAELNEKSVGDLESYIARNKDFVEGLKGILVKRADEHHSAIVEVERRMLAKADKVDLDQAVEGVRSQLQSKASQQNLDNAIRDVTAQLQGKAADQDIKNAVEALRQDVKVTMEGLTTQLHGKADQQLVLETENKLREQLRVLALVRTPTPGPQQASGVSNLVNTNGATPLPNGSGRTVNGSPQPNGGPVNQHFDIQQTVEELVEKQAHQALKNESLTHITLRLQHQYDNLTTDEIVACMVNQMSQMYPDAKDFQNAVRHITANIKNLDKRLTMVNDTAHAASRLATRGTTTAKAASKAAETADVSAKSIRAEVGKMQMTVTELQERIAKSGSTDSSTTYSADGVTKAALEDIHKLQEAIAELRQEAVQSSEVHSSAISHAEEIAQVERETAKVAREDIDKLQATLTKLQQEVVRGDQENSTTAANAEGVAKMARDTATVAREDISKIQKDITELRDKITSFKSAATGSSSATPATEAATAKMRELEHNLISMDATINRVDATVKDHTERLDEMDEVLSSHAARLGSSIENLESGVGLVKTGFENLIRRVDAHDSVLEDGKKQIEALSELVASHDIIWNEGKRVVETVRADMRTLTRKMVTHGSKLEALEKVLK